MHIDCKTEEPDVVLNLEELKVYSVQKQQY